MTLELVHAVYNGFEVDKSSVASTEKLPSTVFSTEWVEDYFKKQQSLKHLLFAVTLDGTPIGEVKIFNVSPRQNKCEVSIALINESVRNLGYGTEALMYAVEYAKDNLNVKYMRARVLDKNLRAQKMLKKLDFREDYRELDEIYFEKDLTSTEIIKPVQIVPMTRELYHEFEKGYLFDLPPKGLRANFKQNVYDPEATDLEYRMHTMLERKLFAITFEGETAPIGIINFKSIHYERGDCEIKCLMQRKEYKNRGYGKHAIELALEYAKLDMGLERVYATVPKKNTHARHVFENLGFRKINEGDYYGEWSYEYEKTL